MAGDCAAKCNYATEWCTWCRGSEGDGSRDRGHSVIRLVCTRVYVTLKQEEINYKTEVIWRVLNFYGILGVLVGSFGCFDGSC